jgi:hypothetical protein
MKTKRFWVIGGEFRDMQFSALHHPQIHGPYTERRDAFDEWRRLTAASTARATVRFHITAE